MSKTLVAYFSQTGNTRQVAEAVYDALEGEKQLNSIEDLKDLDLDPFGIIFIGFPVHSHSVPFPVEMFLKSLPAGKKIALFSTHGSLTGGRLSREALEHATVATPGMRVLGTFSCRGRVSPQALEILRKSPEHNAWTDMAASAHSHPDRGDLEEAGIFARWIMTLAAAQA
jgi:flavodoxin